MSSDHVVLYHYCCRHSARQITDRGFLLPSGGGALGSVSLVWLTGQAVPDREGLGLTSHLIACDRLECQYVVRARRADVEPWIGSAARQSLAFDLSLRTFEDGRRPDTWWIATVPVFAIRDKAYRPPLEVCV